VGVLVRPDKTDAFVFLTTFLSLPAKGPPSPPEKTTLTIKYLSLGGLVNLILDRTSGGRGLMRRNHFATLEGASSPHAFTYEFENAFLTTRLERQTPANPASKCHPSSKVQTTVI
jgi:hypothetical protein